MNWADGQASARGAPGRRPQAPWSGGRQAWLGALLGLALGCPAIEFQQNAVVTLSSFRTQGRGENGARWFLEGQKAVIRGTVFDLQGATVRLEMEDGKTALMTSERCTYHQESGLLESAAAVRVESGDAVLAGVGFDMLITERRLRIRDAVRMEIPQKAVDLSTVVPGGAPAAPAAPAAPPAAARRQP